MKLTAALTGNLDAIMQKEARLAAFSLTSGVKEATEGLKSELRSQITNSGMGTKLANTWRSKNYPNNRLSLNPSGFIWSKAPKLIRLYDKGGIIRSKSGFYLAIPLPSAGKGARGKKVTPRSFEQKTGLRLRFVYRRNAPSLLVADNAKLSKAGRASANIGRKNGASYTRMSGRTTVAVFLLVPFVRIKKRLDVSGAVARWQNRVVPLINKHWQK